MAQDLIPLSLQQLVISVERMLERPSAAPKTKLGLSNSSCKEKAIK